MQRMQFFDCFQFHDDAVFDEIVDPIASINLDAFMVESVVAS